MQESKKVVDIKKGDHIMIQDHPCCVIQLSCTPFLQKKGYRKIHLVGIDIETGLKYEALHTSKDIVLIPSF